jgi:signal transduction histidine kinase
VLKLFNDPMKKSSRGGTGRAILILPPSKEFKMRSLATSQVEEIFLNIMHDLRQPLGNIELSVSYLNLLLGEPRGKLQEQIHNIEEQVERASRILSAATALFVSLRDQECPGAESLERTNSATPALT